MSLDVPESLLTSEELATLASFDRDIADNLDAALAGANEVTTDDIVDGAVTLAKMADIATSRILGRVTASTGDVEALTGTQATTLLDTFTSSLKGLVPPPGASTGRALLDDGTWGQVLSSSLVINVKDPSYGAEGDYDPAAQTGTTDTTAINLAIAACVDGSELVFPPGQYLLDDRINAIGLRNVTIRGSAFATIYWQSGDTGLTGTGGLSDEQARAGFLLQYCRNVTIKNLRGVGMEVQNLTSNIGSFIYLSSCAGSRVERCFATGGYGLVAQDRAANTNGTGDSIAVSSGLVTLTDAGAAFKLGQVGANIIVAGCTNAVNNGQFEIVARPSATTVQYRNAAATAETSSFRYVIDDGDQNTTIDNCWSYNQRGFSRVCAGSTISNCTFERPTWTLDTCGLGGEFTLSGSTITFVHRSGKFLPSDVGKHITITGATTSGNNGRFMITAYTSATTVTWANASGATELHTATGTHWIARGEKNGLGNGVSALTKVSNTMTLVSSTAAFDASDLYKTIRIADATTLANESAFVITAVNSSTSVSYTNASGVAETFSGIWTIDRFDNAIEGSDTYGSSHGVYLFPGTDYTTVINCKFYGIRTTPGKISGSSSPIRGGKFIGCTFVDCGEGVTVGADDSNEHTDLYVEGCTFIDCGTNRPGANNSHVLNALGARAVSFSKNTVFWTRNAIGSVDGRGVSGIVPITVARYGNGTQPIEDVKIINNTIKADPVNCSLGGVGPTVIDVSKVGQRAKWGSGGTLAKNGNTMTLFLGTMAFTAQDIGKTVKLVHSTSAGNDGSFTVTAVPSRYEISYTNASGVAETFGTFHLYERSDDRGGSCLIQGNEIFNVAEIAIQVTQCTGPEVIGNFLHSGIIKMAGNVRGRVAGNREIGTYTQTARIRYSDGETFPTEYDNLYTNNSIGSAQGRAMGIAVSSNPVDYPLRGVSVKVMPTEAKPQVIYGWGSGHVNGIRFFIHDSAGAVTDTFTYRSSIVDALTEFNSAATLNALITTAGYTVVEYGTQFADSVNDGHYLIIDVAGTSDAQFGISSDVVNQTSLVIPRNNATSTICMARGKGTAGPVGSEIVAWSQHATWSAGVSVGADNVEAKDMLLANGWYADRDSNDSGSSMTIVVGTHADEADAEMRVTFR